MTRLIAACTTILAGALVWAGMTTSMFVTDQGAYAFYMPRNYGVRVVTCKVTIWGVAEHSYQVSDRWLDCSLAAYYAAAEDRDPSVPIQHDPKRVRMLPQAPR